ncbi:MAG: hypothetical protein EAY65_00280 [Alphaproteobacteria bacterium]|nr:MAG: hypothetical protein EAY65_00280 [Alphaproteobacteria bacterium]
MSIRKLDKPPYTLCKNFTLCIQSYARPPAGDLVKQGFLKRNPMLNRGGGILLPPTQSSAVFY